MRGLVRVLVLGMAACGGGVEGGGAGAGCPDGFVLVPAGVCRMGSDPAEPGRAPNEGGPGGGPRDVRIDHDLCVQATETTRRQWRDLLGTGPWGEGGCDDCPVTCVGWFEAVAYCNALSRREGLPECYLLDGGSATGCGAATPGAEPACGRVAGPACARVEAAGPACRGYRLPTEAEWERAARAGSAGAVYATGCDGPQFLDPEHLGCEAGNAALDPVAWFCGNSGMQVHPAGPADPAARAPNAWGLHDVLGNVAEWVEDAYHPSYDGAPVDGGAWAAPDAATRVVRGGSWLTDAAATRLAARRADPPGFRAGDVGFRPCRTAPGR